jgi:hypothetical protein
MHDRSSSSRPMLKARCALRRCRTLLTCRPQRQGLVIEAAVALVRARLLLLAVPFQRLSTGWGELLPIGDPRIASHAAVVGSAADAETARAIGWAVTATANVMPFTAMCLQQAVAAREMLARRGIAAVIHYGAGRDAAGRLVAHAWLDAAGARVTGYPVAPHIAAIGAFVPQP